MVSACPEKNHPRPEFEAEAGVRTEVLDIQRQEREEHTEADG